MRRPRPKISQSPQQVQDVDTMSVVPGLESVHAGLARVRDSGRKRLRLSHATTGCASPTSVLDALERDLVDCGSEPSRHFGGH